MNNTLRPLSSQQIDLSPCPAGERAKQNSTAAIAAGALWQTRHLRRRRAMAPGFLGVMPEAGNGCVPTGESPNNCSASASAGGTRGTSWYGLLGRLKRPLSAGDHRSPHEVDLPVHRAAANPSTAGGSGIRRIIRINVI
ncbi:hypothetical protein [Micromonospora sp. NBC_01638]|uniref:hypothetical protein n=1 Tax=Micromonospora sp. NBC_01638 TaxID=2975982 RepID=UPI0038684647|nr:hypothetical protein OG811_24165 [Micromonospora sp. NBC_01638]